jgi:hypothetical protein
VAQKGQFATVTSKKNDLYWVIRDGTGPLKICSPTHSPNAKVKQSKALIAVVERAAAVAAFGSSMA